MSSTSSPVGPTPMEIRDDSKTPTHHLSFNGGEDRDNSPAPNRADGEPAHGKRSEGASASTRPDEVEVDVGASERKKEERGADRFYVGGYAVGGSKENRERLSLLDSPLFRAVGNADADAVDDLYKKDPHQILKTYDWGWSISHFAAATGMYEILEWTAERRETKELLTRVNDCGLTPMHYAAANGQYDALEFLVRTVPGSCFSLRKAQGSDRTRLRMHLRRVQRRQEAHRHREEGQVQEASDRHASQEVLIMSELRPAAHFHLSVLKRKASPEGLKLHMRKGEEKPSIPPLDPDDRMANSAGCSCCFWRRNRPDRVPVLRKQAVAVREEERRMAEGQEGRGEEEVLLRRVFGQ
uniref:Uncharacterized protein n=1 Tax=Guillardia theta TaxID=55529 RepID=A0A7S4PQM0_GUITH|mmetsp:Transcript_9448/g.31592  ORF Transcript_9448/g.31592 Transcript_9448/m.31592 type:complete len:354 (+) Transcript_9448:171-1232(+)